VLVALVLGWAFSGGGRIVPRAAAERGARQEARQRVSSALRVVRAGYALPSAVQRELALPFGRRIVLAGGLDGGGHSAVGAFSLAPDTGRVTALGSVPQAFHDAAGAIVGGRLLVFGGGTGTRTTAVPAFGSRSP